MGILTLLTGMLIAMFVYDSKWLVDIEEVEKSNTAKKYLENASTSQNQMMLKGDTNIFSAFISTNIKVEDQHILNKIYHELKYNKNLNNNIVNNTIDLCTYINEKYDHIGIVNCKETLEKNYTFISMKSNGVELKVDPGYTDSITHLNSLNQNGYSITSNKVLLSNNKIFQFDSNLREIESIAAGDRNYVNTDVISYENNETLLEDNIEVFELNNIINTSITNSNTLINNIVEVDTTTKYSTIKQLIQNTDSDGNIIPLTKGFDNIEFDNATTLSNSNVVGAFGVNKSTTMPKFSLSN